MPRRNKPNRKEPTRKPSAPTPSDFEEMVNRLRTPTATARAGYQVQESTKQDRRYKCPYCEGWIEPGVSHVVAYPTGKVDDRRHYHRSCWAKQARQ